MGNEPNYREDMQLPAGKKCGDCFASRHCIALGMTTAERTSCDFWPNRFKEPRPAQPADAPPKPESGR